MEVNRVLIRRRFARTLIGKSRAGIACKRPADICVGSRQNNVGERLAQVCPGRDREDPLLASIVRYLNQVHFGK